MRAAGLVVIAVGVAGLFLGLFGIPREESPQVAAGGVVLLVAGVILLLFGLRPLHLKAPHASVFVATVLAIALHAYENFPSEDPSAFTAGMFAWSLAPYALCLFVASFSKSWIVPLAGAVTALLFDLKVHNDLFVNTPTSSTAGLALLFVPLWNLLVFAPLAMLAAWLLLRLRPHANETAP